MSSLPDTYTGHQASELVLHADNDRNLYHQSHMPIVKNLQGKMKKGVYDHEAAKTLWGYHADRAAKSYTKEFGSPGDKWHEMFSPAVRREAASHWADRERDEMQRGNYNLKESLVTDQEDEIETLETGNEENPGATAEISSLKDYAAAIAGASLEDKPADVAQIFGDAVRQRMADYVSEYAAVINEEGFGYGPEEDEFPVEDYPEDEEPEEEIEESSFHLNPAKKGMWKGKSLSDIKKAKAVAKHSGNVTREREATFAINAKEGKFKKGS